MEATPKNDNLEMVCSWICSWGVYRINAILKMEEDDFEFDEVMGAHKKRSKLSGLSKKNLTDEEMFEILG